MRWVLFSITITIIIAIMGPCVTLLKEDEEAWPLLEALRNEKQERFSNDPRRNAHQLLKTPGVVCP